MDWAQVTLFLMILARMSGFVLFNPIFGRQTLPGIVKSGLILLLGITAFSATSYRPAVPGSVLEMGVRVLLEMGVGYLTGIVMNLFFYIPVMAGSMIILIPSILAFVLGQKQLISGLTAGSVKG